MSMPPNPWGNRQGSSPDIKLNLYEINRSTQRKETTVTYKLRTEGLPADKDYTLWVKASIAPAEGGFQRGGYILDDRGQLVCKGKQSQGEKNWNQCIDLADTEFSFSRFHAGESFDFAITSDDGTVKTYAKAIPAPLEAEHRSCRLWAERISSDSRNYAIFGKQFIPNEIVRYTSTSGTEILQGTYRADGNGNLPMVIMHPAVVGKKGGIARFTAESSSCKPSLVYPWGNKNKP